MSNLVSNFIKMLEKISNIEGLTFDDVLLLPAKSDVLPYQTDVRTKVTRNVSLNIPLISSAMDTVTEYKLAIAIAREGGMGILHKNMSIADQVNQVRNVKRAENGMILDPVVLSNQSKVKDALSIMAEYKIGGIPIVDNSQKLCGIVTNRDLRFNDDPEIPILEVMTKEKLITVKKGMTLTQARKILQKYKIEKLPVVDKDNKIVGLITYRDIDKVQKNPYACKDEFGRLRVGAAVGVGEKDFERVEKLIEAFVDIIVIDTAHGHHANVINFLKRVKKSYPNKDVLVGNIATREAAEDLLEAGADSLKVGIGPGSICTTRVIAGVGSPQLTAVMEVYKALEGTGVPLISDGGIRFSGDVVKAIAAGADVVMLGSMFAGVDESPGETVIYDGRKFKTYRGMGSLEAMQRGSKDRYFQGDEQDIKKLVPEGISGRVPYKGYLSETVYQLVGGLRSGMGYCGAKDIKSLRKTKFIRVTNSSILESHPHDVAITREAPNYSAR